MLQCTQCLAWCTQHYIQYTQGLQHNLDVAFDKNKNFKTLLKFSDMSIKACDDHLYIFHEMVTMFLTMFNFGNFDIWEPD